MKTTISKEANPNYLARIIEIKELQKHPNADALQIAIVNFERIITGMDAKVGDVMVFFPVECVINNEFLSFTNSFRHTHLNADKTKEGFFEDNGRVKAVKLRGIASMGYLVPIDEIMKFTGIFDYKVGDSFDTIGDIKMLEKYFIPTKNIPSQRLGRQPRESRLIDGQVRLHVDTEKLANNMFEINPESLITVTYKYHGTSWWVGNLLVKKKKTLFDKILRREPHEYDYVYGSRRVVKNEFDDGKKQHYYDEDLWGDIKNELKESIPKGYTLYGECVGFTKGGKAIQKDYDYGCEIGKYKLLIYRITYTNVDGVVTDLSSAQVKAFCDDRGLEYVHVLYKGKAKDMFNLDIEQHWHKNVFDSLKKNYTDKDCIFCKNKVPEEGIVLRIEDVLHFKAYKLKGDKFLLYETKELDSGEENIEG